MAFVLVQQVAHYLFAAEAHQVVFPAAALQIQLGAVLALGLAGRAFPFGQGRGRHQVAAQADLVDEHLPRIPLHPQAHFVLGHAQVGMNPSATLAQLLGRGLPGRSPLGPELVFQQQIDGHRRLLQGGPRQSGGGWDYRSRVTQREQFMSRGLFLVD